MQEVRRICVGTLLAVTRKHEDFPNLDVSDSSATHSHVCTGECGSGGDTLLVVQVSGT